MEKIRISFVGDIMLGRYINEKYSTFESKFKSSNPKKEIFGPVLNTLESSDLVIGNLETTITNNKEKYPKVFNFRMDPQFTEVLKLNKNIYLSVGNNHILDYSLKGLEDTIENLDKNKIKYSGAGKNLEKSREMAIFTIKNRKIGIIGAAEFQDPNWEAKGDKPGVNYVNIEDGKEFLKFIPNLKKSVDILILSIHWGPNYKLGISKKYQKFAKSLIKAGVDIIHGHSSHHTKCIESTDDKVIMYGIGDFIDDYAIDDRYRNDLGMIAQMEISNKNKMELKEIPTKIENLSVKIVKNEKLIETISADCSYI